MTELKTKVNDGSVLEFLERIPDAEKKRDSYAILDLMKEVTGFEPKMWGDSIIGFGACHYRYPSGHEGDMALIGFSPRKNNLTIYIVPGFEHYADLLDRLGKFKTAKSCLYIKKLADIEISVLKEIVKDTVRQVRTLYPQENAK